MAGPPQGTFVGLEPTSIQNKPRHKAPPLPPSTAPYRTIEFFAEAFFNPADNLRFSVLSGDQPPTVTGGYAKWQTIDLPLRRGLTIFQGYDPVIMTVSVRFIMIDTAGGWLTDRESALQLEQKIHNLEWMAGESWEQGPSPKVWLTTFDGKGNTVGLIPLWYQSEIKAIPGLVGTGNVGPWIITALDWDKNPIRGDHGFRTRQDATVTVQLWTSGQLSPQGSNVARPKATIFISRAGADTALLIARQSATAYAPQLALAIIKAPQNAALKLRSVNQPIKHGKKVRVPSGG